MTNDRSPTRADTPSEGSTDHDPVLEELLEGNETHVENLPGNYFDPVQEAQQPAVVTICCADSRVPQEGMWATQRPGRVFTPSNIGNQAWDDHNGSKIVDGSLLYPLHFTDTEAIAVVGHTGCGAVTAAYNVAMGDDPPGPQGVTKWVDMLVPVVEAGLESELIDDPTDSSDSIDSTGSSNETGSGDDETEGEEPLTEWKRVNQLVEYNVDHQASFLRASPDVPEHVSIYGFVYDFHGVYGEDPGRAYLVNLEGETQPDVIRDRIPERFAHATSSLLY